MEWNRLYQASHCPIQLLVTRGGHAQLFSKSAVLILQLEGTTSAIAIPQLFKETMFRNRDIAIPQSQHFLKSETWELHSRNFLHIFGRGIWSIHEKKIGGKKSHAAVPSRGRDSSKKIFDWFLIPSWAKEKGLESSGTGRRLRKVAKLRKSNFGGP